MRVPGTEPAGEGGRFVALLDKDDGRVLVAACRVHPQIFLDVEASLLGLRLVGKVSDPQENLCEKSVKKKLRTLPEANAANAPVYSGLLEVFLLCSQVTSHLLPCVQQHHVLFVQVALGKVVHLGYPELTTLIGAFKEAGQVKRLLPRESETE